MKRKFDVKQIITAKDIRKPLTRFKALVVLVLMMDFFAVVYYGTVYGKWFEPVAGTLYRFWMVMVVIGWGFAALNLLGAIVNGLEMIAQVMEGDEDKSPNL